MYSDWTTTFFNGFAVEFWVEVAPAPSAQEIEFLRNIFGDGGELLDVACGAGRYTIPLAQAGYSMTGVDLSDDFLDVAKQRGPDIAWEKRDVRELPWRARFDGALCFGNSFGYFPAEETRALLRGVANALKPGGAFVLEAPATAESLLPNLVRERRMEVGDITFSSVNRYDEERKRLDIEYTFEKGRVREVKRATMRIFTVAEVEAMLREAGFEVEEVHKSALFVARAK